MKLLFLTKAFFQMKEVQRKQLEKLVSFYRKVNFDVTVMTNLTSNHTHNLNRKLNFKVIKNPTFLPKYQALLTV